MSTKELDSRAAEYFSIMETIEALQAQAEAIRDAMKAAMTEHDAEELEGRQTIPVCKKLNREAITLPVFLLA